MLSLVNKLFNSAAAWSFLATTLRLGNVVLVLPIVLRFMSSEDLGWWYIFLSLGSVSLLLDMGFSQTITRSIACLWVGAPRLIPVGISRLEGEQDSLGSPNWKCLGNLLATCQYLYVVLGILIGLFMLGLGVYWLHATKSATQPPYAAFIAYACSIAIGFIVAFWANIIVGINRVRQAQQISVMATLSGYAVTVILVQQGYGLWAMVMSVWCKMIFERLAIYLYLQRQYPQLACVKGSFDRAILKILWPMSWRTGLVGMGAYMILSANTLICARNLGLQETASYGLSQQVVGILTGLSAIWVSVKAPEMAQLRARNMTEDLVKLFTQRIWWAILTYVIGAVGAFVFAPELLHRIGSKTLLLPWPIFLIQMAIGFLEMHHSQYGLLVITGNSNPFVLPALISGIVIVIISSVLTAWLGVLGLIISVGVVQASFNNWWPVGVGIRSLNLSAKQYWLIFLNNARPFIRHV